ncbi:MAG: PP2C family protein-serine/threonine phosphatase [Acidimicrobiia bacterium]
MSLRNRLTLVAAGYLVVFAIGGAAVTGAFRSWNRELDQRRLLFDTASDAARLESAYLDQETGQRGYVITGDPEFLRPYRRGQSEATRLATEIVQAVGGDREILAALADVEAAASTWLHVSAEPEIIVRGADGPEAAAALLEQGTGRALFEDLRGTLTDLQLVVDARAIRSGDRADVDRNWLVTVLGVLLAAVVALTVLVAWLLQRWVVRPLDRIIDATTRIARGEAVPVTVEGPSEMVEVADAVDTMQRTIVDQRDRAVRAREAVEQNTVLALQLRTELTSGLGDYPTGWSVAAGMRATEGFVAGDCYDVTLLSPHEIGVVVIDIAGHGALAAVSAFKCKELLKAALRSGLEPGACLEWLIDQELGLGDSFFTAIVAAIDTSTGLCRYANAGHPPPLVVCDRAEHAWLAPTGPLFGFGLQGWTTGQTTIGPSSLLVVYTDGLVEARNDEGFYGEQPLLELLTSIDHAQADVIVEDVLAGLSSFSPGRLADDVTIVVLCHGA